MRSWSLALFGGLVMVSAAPAQAPAWRFQWQAGQALTYRASQSIAVTEEVSGNKVATQTKLTTVKRWQVQAVDPAGVATVQMTLVSLRQETTTPGGDVLLFDSDKPDDSDKDMARELGKYVGQPLAVLRINSLGQVVEVKDSKFGTGSEYESEPPFSFVLPAAGPAAPRSWERNYQIVLGPPQGTGEKYQAVQKYSVKSVDAAQAAIGVSTELKSPPQAAGDRLPLLRFLPAGEIVFNPGTGMMMKANLQVNQEVTDHEGKGSRYQFQSSYSEEYVGDK